MPDGSKGGSRVFIVLCAVREDDARQPHRKEESWVRESHPMVEMGLQRPVAYYTDGKANDASSGSRNKKGMIVAGTSFLGQQSVGSKIKYIATTYLVHNSKPP